MPVCCQVSEAPKTGPSPEVIEARLQNPVLVVVGCCDYCFLLLIWCYCCCCCCCCCCCSDKNCPVFFFFFRQLSSVVHPFVRRTKDPAFVKAADINVAVGLKSHPVHVELYLGMNSHQDYYMLSRGSCINLHLPL